MEGSEYIREESEMHFYRKCKEILFDIENQLSDKWKEGNKIPEFILLTENKKKLLFFKAKKSHPKKLNSGDVEKLKERLLEVFTEELQRKAKMTAEVLQLESCEIIPHFELRVQEIVEKFFNASLCISPSFREKISQLCPSEFNEVDWSKIHLVYILIIKEAEEEWLSPVTNFLRKRIKPLRCFFPRIDCLVLNENIARVHHYIGDAP